MRSECECCDRPLDDIQRSQGKLARKEHEGSLVALDNRIEGARPSEWRLQGVEEGGALTATCAGSVRV